MHRIHLPLADALPRIVDGDLLQFRPRRWSVAEQLTAVAGRGDYCHSGLACRWRIAGDHRVEVMCLESRRSGIRAVTLRSQVERYPGRIDVYETNRGRVFPRFEQLAMCRAMRDKTGRPYNLRLLLRAMLSHTLLWRLFIRAQTADNGHDTDHLGPEFCSQAVASAARVAGGEDPCPALRDRSTEPNDLTRSTLFNHNGAYRFTLVP